jgi:phosphoglycerate dehydrogenase-like enzyme
LGINRTGREKAGFQECFKLEEFIEDPPEIDTLISILPLTHATIGLLDHNFFRNLSNLHFINVGRGDVIKEKVLIELLDSGKIRRATLDVFSSEPLPSDSELWQHEKVIITPHQAAITNIDDLMISFREALAAWNDEKKNKLFIDLKKQY